MNGNANALNSSVWTIRNAPGRRAAAVRWMISLRRWPSGGQNALIFRRSRCSKRRRPGSMDKEKKGAAVVRNSSSLFFGLRWDTAASFSLLLCLRIRTGTGRKARQSCCWQVMPGLCELSWQNKNCYHKNWYQHNLIRLPYRGKRYYDVDRKKTERKRRCLLWKEESAGTCTLPFLISAL